MSRTFSVVVVLSLALSACERQGVVEVDEPEVTREELSDLAATLQAQLDEMTDRLEAVELEAGTDDADVPLDCVSTSPLVLHLGGEASLVGGFCAQRVEIGLLTQDDQVYERYPATRIASDAFIGEVRGTGRYRLYITERNGEILCLPSSDCNYGALQVDEPFID
jgi:hypothetical protein